MSSARQRWLRSSDPQLTFRMFLVMFLLAALYVGFLVLLWSTGADFVTLFIVAGVMAGAQYFFSDRLVLWSMGARVVTPREAPDLYARVERLAALADLPVPKVAIVNTGVPNAFATGRSPSNAVVAVTTGLLERLDPPELEGVLAHELAHVKNRDVAVITIASFFATVIYLFFRFSAYSGMYGGYGGRRGRDRGGAGLIIIGALVVWALSFLLIRALSRYREYAADRGAAILTGAPSALASALLKISGTMGRIPQRDLREMEGLNAFFIVPAISGDALTELLSTHPSLENRLRRLREMQRELEGVEGLP